MYDIYECGLLYLAKLNVDIAYLENTPKDVWMIVARGATGGHVVEKKANVMNHYAPEVIVGRLPPVPVY